MQMTMAAVGHLPGSHFAVPEMIVVAKHRGQDWLHCEELRRL
jgi:hypothetical protein